MFPNFAEKTQSNSRSFIKTRLPDSGIGAGYRLGIVGLRRREEHAPLLWSCLAAWLPRSLENGCFSLCRGRGVYTYPLCPCSFLTDLQIPLTAIAPKRRYSQHLSLSLLPFHCFLTKFSENDNLNPLAFCPHPLAIFCSSFPNCFSRWLLHK